jgi:hypothetical protein
MGVVEFLQLRLLRRDLGFEIFLPFGQAGQQFEIATGNFGLAVAGVINRCGSRLQGH